MKENIFETIKKLDNNGCEDWSSLGSFPSQFWNIYGDVYRKFLQSN